MARSQDARYRHIIRDPDIHGGAAVIRGTRVPVRTLAFYWRETGDKQRILRDYPRVSPDALDEAIRYYEEHRVEIDAELGRDVEDESSIAAA